jgi:predicted enzyme related to lactoylglutathione lyase
MRALSLGRLAAVFVSTVLLGAESPAPSAGQIPAGAPDMPGRPARFQRLNDPASREQHPGKFVWAELITTDPVTAAKFYSGILGWTANIIEHNGRTYTVLSNGRRPVAGLAPPQGTTHPRVSRWISYVTVPDINATLALVPEAGGQVQSPAQDFPDRATQAIITDSEGSSVGLLRSGSGDSADAEPQPGDWHWFELYARDPKTAAAFYGRVLPYSAIPDTSTNLKSDWLLLTDGFPRAGITPLTEREEPAPGWLGIVRVNDLDGLMAQVVRLGGQILMAPHGGAYRGRLAIVTDPTGGTIGLVEFENSAGDAFGP